MSIRAGKLATRFGALSMAAMGATGCMKTIQPADDGIAKIINASTKPPQYKKSRFLKLGVRTSQPIGHYRFCKEFENECKDRTNNPSVISYDKNIDLLEHVNSHVWNTIDQKTDQEIYGVEEHWVCLKNIAVGDCEDHACLKRDMLIQYGIPASALLMTAAKQSNGEGHAFLTVRTDKGDIAADNKERDLKFVNEVDYTILKTIDPRNSGQWVKASLVDVQHTSNAMAIVNRITKSYSPD